MAEILANCSSWRNDWRRGNFDAAESILANEDISLAVLTAAQLETFRWIDGLSQAN